MTDIENIGKGIPIISIIAILLGIFNLSNFYSLHDIEIVNFLDASEILLSFTDLLILLIAIAAFSILWNLIMSSFLKESNKKEKSESIKNEATTEYIERAFADLNKMLNRFQKALIKIAVIYDSIFAILIVYILVLPKFGCKFSSVGCDVMFLFAITLNSIVLGANATSLKDIIIVSDVRPRFKTSYVYFLKKTFGFALIFLVFTFLLRNYVKWSNLENGLPKYNVTLRMDNNKTFQTSENIYYISSTKNFYFFKDRISKLIVIIPSRDVKEIDIQKLRNGL